MVKVQNVKRTFEARFLLEEHEDGKRVAVLQVDKLEDDLKIATELARHILKDDFVKTVFITAKKELTTADIDQTDK